MLDRLRLAVRPRSPWEAVDLGLALLRAQAGPVCRVWLAMLLPLALILALACPGRPWLAPLILWWLKPALDRPVLHVLAKATFGEAPGVAGALAGLPGYCRRGLAATLLWRRLSPDRGLLLPVWQLEAPDGPGFRRRRRVLLLRGKAQSRLLTLVCLVFTAVLALGAATGLAYLWPGTEGPGLLGFLAASRGHRQPWLDALLALLPALAMAAVEPVYVAAGYALYLNRRVQLEAWDLELAFRRLGRRARERAGLVLVALLACSALALGAQSGPALTGPKAALAEVLKAPEFATRHPAWRLRPRRGDQPPPAAPAPPPAWVMKALDLIARVMKVVLPALVILGLLRILWKHRRTLALAARPAPGSNRVPARLFGLDIRPAGLPDDLPAVAARLWDQGDPRGALSLLYRGALAHLAHGLGAPLTAGSTEGDCLALAGRMPEPGARYFARLMASWQGVAYGGQAAAAQDRTLCDAWSSHFSVPRRAERP
jgi:hypothetical protein